MKPTKIVEITDEGLFVVDGDTKIGPFDTRGFCRDVEQARLRHEKHQITAYAYPDAPEKVS